VRRPFVLLVALLVAIVTAGCGVPLDSSPRAIPTTTSTTPTTDSTAPTTGGSPGARTVSAYFLNDDTLERVLYPVDDEPTLADALTFVLGDPPQSLTTSIPSGTRLLSSKITGRVASVNLTSEINDISGQPQKQAYAQMAFTALALPTVTAVRFMVDGKEVDAPTDNGNRGVVTGADYEGSLNPLDG